VVCCLAALAHSFFLLLSLAQSGNVKSMRAALEAAHKGWGTSCVRMQYTNTSLISMADGSVGAGGKKSSEQQKLTARSLRYCLCVLCVCVRLLVWPVRDKRSPRVPSNS
jgi:hypothetical protein